MGVKVLEKPTVTVEPELCKGCGLCIDACPQDVLKFHEKFNTKGYHYAYYVGDGCTGCGVCFMPVRSRRQLSSIKRDMK